MALTHRLKRHAAASIQSVSLRQVLAAILGAEMVILVIVPFLLGIAIKQRTLAPPQLDLQLGRLQLLAATTHTPDCDGYITPCSPKLIAPVGQEFYVIWVLTPTGQPAPPDERSTSTRLLILPLRQPRQNMRWSSQHAVRLALMSRPRDVYAKVDR